MPRDASGNMTLPTGNPVVTGTAISSTVHNATIADLAAEIQDSLSRSGKGGMNAPFQNASGTEALPGATFAVEPSTGWFWYAAGVIRMSILGAWKFAFSAAGLVIKGTLGLMDSGGTNKTVTLTAPSGLASDYTLTMPTALPASTTTVVLSATGQLSTSASTSNVVASSSSGTVAGAATTYTDITNLTLSFTATGRTICLSVAPDTSGTLGSFINLNNGVTARYCKIKVLRDSTALFEVQHYGRSSANTSIPMPPIFDAPASGTYTYKVQYLVENADATLNIQYARLVAYEL